MCPLGLLEQLGVRLALHSDFAMAPAQVSYHVLRVACHEYQLIITHSRWCWPGAPSTE